jgi:DNA invertase Pin-like site-specific DNA recombinase
MKQQQAISYLRVSGKGQLDGDGFDRQREAIARFAASAGYLLVAEFREEGVSGTTELEGRKALMDGLARDAFVQESIIRQAIRVGARILTADGDDLTDDENPARKLTRQIFGAIAEFEKRCLVLKLSAARARVRKTTGRCEGRKPFGSRDGESKIVEQIQGLRSNGLTFAAIAERLNADGARTRQGKPFSPGYVYHVARRAA